MKKLILILLLAGFTVFLPTSCVDKFLNNYLDKSPEQGLTEDLIFTRLTNFKAYFDAVYAGTLLQAGSMWSSTTWSDFNIKLFFPFYWDAWDQKYSTEGVTDAADAGRYMEGHAWKSGNMSETIVNKMTYDGSRNPVLWTSFITIRRANMALQNVSRIADATPQEMDDLRGQAYFVRALSHFALFQFWGPMPYITKVIGPDDQWDIPRLSKHETCTKIAADFDSAYVCFNKAGKIRRDPPLGVPNHLNYNANEMYRPNGMVALAWKAKALMFGASPLNNKNGKTDWEEAAVASWAALKLAQDNGLILLPAATRYLNYYGADCTDEDLWSYTAGLLSWNAGNWLTNTNRGNGQTFYNGVFFASTGSNSGVCPTQNFVDKYETIWGDPLNTAADRNAATLAGHYNEQDPFANRDPRLDMDIITNQSSAIGWTSGKAQIWYQGTTYGELLNQSYLGITRTGYYLRKVWWNNSTKNQVSSIFADPLCRLAECYLNYAECANEAYGPNGKAPAASLTAVDAINVVRARAGLPNVLSAFTGSTDLFRPRIKNERNVELSFEGHYYNDIIRWMDLPASQSSTLIGMIAEKVTVSSTYPTGYKYARSPLSADRQPVWKPQMYYLPFNNSDALKMKNFVPNPVW
ncbi:MAG: RagB/SusD family nutrient uptake outer membrane protein [Prolixibacteraceae bacterium]